MTQFKFMPGALVRVTKVDPYGFCGRIWHPSKEHEGRLGVIVQRLDEVDDLRDTSDGAEPFNSYIVSMLRPDAAGPHWTQRFPDQDDLSPCDSRWFMEFELEEVRPVTSVLDDEGRLEVV